MDWFCEVLGHHMINHVIFRGGTSKTSCWMVHTHKVKFFQKKKKFFYRKYNIDYTVHMQEV